MTDETPFRRVTNKDYEWTRKVSGGRETVTVEEVAPGRWKVTHTRFEQWLVASERPEVRVFHEGSRGPFSDIGEAIDAAHAYMGDHGGVSEHDARV